jgi:acetyltransferase-like isoleucine patch superfamily enzyme
VHRYLRRLRGEAVRRISRRVARWGDLYGGDPEANAFGAFGAKTFFGFPQGVVYGQRWMSIGDRTMIGPHVSLTVGMHPDQEMVTDPALVIGDGCLIGRSSSIVAHFQITIEDDVFFGPSVYVTDQNHTYEDISVPIGRQWPTEQPVRIGAGSWIGTGSIILPGADIGRHVVVAAGSVVRGKVPDYSVAAGVPAKVVRQRGADEQWVRPAREQ